MGERGIRVDKWTFREHFQLVVTSIKGNPRQGMSYDAREARRAIEQTQVNKGLAND